MGKIMKFIYSFMLIVLVLLGALFLVVGIDINSLPLTAVELGFLDDLLSNVVFVKGFFLSLGVVLIVFSIVILVTLKQNSNRGYDLILEDERGSILLTRKSLQALMEKTIDKFFDVKCVKTKAIIIENQRIEAKALVDYFGNEDIKALSEKIRADILKSLTDFTEITDIRLDLKIDKKEVEDRRNGRY